MKVNIDGLRTIIGAAIVALWLWICSVALLAQALSELSNVTTVRVSELLFALYAGLYVVAVPVTLHFLKD